MKHSERYELIRTKLARAQLEYGDNVRICEAYELCNEGITISKREEWKGGAA